MRWSCGRWPTEDDRPARSEPRVVPTPERARRGQRQEMRQIHGQGIDDGNRPAPVTKSHMDMNTKGLDPAGKPLHLFDEFGIALNGHHLCIPPVTEGMCSG